MTAKTLAKTTAEMIKHFVGKAIADAAFKIDALENRLNELGADLQQKVAAGEFNGADGKDGIDGKDGVDGKDGIDGRDGLDGKDGIDGKDGANGIDGKEGAAGKDGIDGRDGLDGKDGLDALQIQPVDMDEFKSYARGAYVHYKGGTLYAFRKTDIIDEWKGSLEQHGWAVAMNGVADIQWTFEDERSFSVKSVLTDGTVAEKTQTIPVPLYKGTWEQGKYMQGDMVTKRGSVWHANKDTEESPGTGSDDWTLSVKEGRQGRSA